LRHDVLDDMTEAELDAIESNVPAVFVKRYCDRNKLPIYSHLLWAKDLFYQLRIALGFKEGNAT
jgi:hypothetical protein